VADIAGVPDGKGHILLPLYHMTAKTDICVTINADGKFLRHDETPLSIPIPCTEESSTRTGRAEPHPLHEQLTYLALNKAKRTAYLLGLEAWCESHPKIKAVHKYIAANTILEDLRSGNVEISDKLFVRFRVETDAVEDHDLWKDKNIALAWQNYYQSILGQKEQTICYVTGMTSPTTSKHPKGTNMSAFGAKLVSCNDDINYTYKGRFRKPEQANAISASASQKAHAMLKYLVAAHGHKVDTQAIVAWAIDNGEAQPDPFSSSDYLYGVLVKTESDRLQEAQGELALDYTKKLRHALMGLGNAKALEGTPRRIAVMAMDAATTGRMGITFYQDMPQNQYIQRLIDWHESCNWWFRRDGFNYVSAPGANRIIAAVYGEPKGEGYKKIQKQARERLLYHIVCGQPLDRGWISAAVARASRPLAYDDIKKWRWAFAVACAIVRKHYNQKTKKEEFGLALDKTQTDRSYLFGRLLALADRLESHARHLQESKTGGTEKRPTNAVRYMSAFASKPLRTWKLIFSQLNPYIQRLNGAQWYQQQIDEIMSLFGADEFNDKSLDGKYLLGYSLQRRELSPASNKDDDKNKEDENDELD
jgi:CRISPR-associated protein Csd1